MTRDELTKNQKELIEAVERLALIYSANASLIPDKAFDFWFDAAKGATLKEIKQVIGDWSKQHNRMMSPADLYKALQALRTNRREAAHVAQIEEERHSPMSEAVKREFDAAMERTKRYNGSPTDWAKTLRIKEAYGFAMTEHMRQCWRNALGYPSSYRFEDMEGVFPLDDAPDERCSLYHDSHVLFAREYQAAHGHELVYDKTLAAKRYFSQPNA